MARFWVAVALRLLFVAIGGYLIGTLLAAGQVNWAFWSFLSLGVFVLFFLTLSQDRPLPTEAPRQAAGVSSEELRLEYEQINENLRHYGNMRFAILIVSLAITTGLIAVVFGERQTSLSQMANTLLHAAGLGSAIVFWVMQERAADYWHGFWNRAVTVENALGLDQHTERPIPRVSVLVTATNASRSLYFGMIVFWVASLYMTLQR